MEPIASFKRKKNTPLKGENMADHNFMKRMTPFLILEILKNHTDDTHGLQVSQVVELLEEDYAVTMERKAVSRILNDLYELTQMAEAYSWKHPMPYTILCDTKRRSTGDIRGNWRIYKPFEDVEVRLLTDAVQAVQGYPTGRVVEKLRGLGSLSMQNTLRKSPATGRENAGMPYTMDEIERAIRAEKKLAFEDRKEGHLVVSPYHMALRHGVYYLVCYHEAKGNLAVFRVEDLRHATMLDAAAKDYHMVKGASRWHYDLTQFLDGNLPQTPTSAVG